MTFERELKGKTVSDYIQDASYNCGTKKMSVGRVYIKEPHIPVKDVLEARDKIKKKILKEIDETIKDRKGFNKFTHQDKVRDISLIEGLEQAKKIIEKEL